MPDNYIEQPPDNLESVRGNLNIVARALDPQTYPESSPMALIDELRTEVSLSKPRVLCYFESEQIYPVIDDVMRKAIVVLSEYLDLEAKSIVRSLEDTCKVEKKKYGFDARVIIPTLKNALEKKFADPGNLNAALLEQLSEIVHDLEYHVC